eukprot:2102741-Alexandrium_andersonii.AAC.1
MGKAAGAPMDMPYPIEVMEALAEPSGQEFEEAWSPCPYILPPPPPERGHWQGDFDGEWSCDGPRWSYRSWGSRGD